MSLTSSASPRSAGLADRNRIDSLTGLRGIAALWVATYHLLLPAALVSGPPARFLGRGYLAVDLFFVLSGFVLARTYGARFGRPNLLSGMAGFLCRRLARIYPLYGLILLARLGYTALRYGSFHLPRPWIAAPLAHPWFAIPANLLLVQSWGVAPSIIGPAWSVSTEWAAYMAFPVLAVVMLHARPAAATGGAAVAAALVLAAAHHGHLDAWDGQTTSPLLRCLGGFTLGLGMSRLSGWPAAVRLASHAGAAYGVCLGLAAGLAAGVPDLFVYPFLPSLILVLATGRTGLVRLVSSAVFVWLGEVSYALYLLHVFLLHPLDQARAACRLMLPPHAADALAASLIMALLLAAAEIAHRFIERPARVWLQAAAAQARSRRSSLAHPPADRPFPIDRSRGATPIFP